MGTEYIHKKGIIHRDLKLANILIDGDMQMKICDFGLATLEADAISEAHIVMGTTNYLAPEVINRQGFKRRSDIWAIGVIAFVLLYGYKPFEGDDETTTHHRISKADYRYLIHEQNFFLSNLNIFITIPKSNEVPQLWSKEKNKIHKYVTCDT